MEKRGLLVIVIVPVIDDQNKGVDLRNASRPILFSTRHFIHDYFNNHSNLIVKC